MFKLRVQNVAFWLVAPIMLSRYTHDQQVHERVDSMWHIHENRVRRGLGETVKASGLYSPQSHKQDSNF